MNVNQILEELPKRYPEISIRNDDETVSSWKWFRLQLPNGWQISCGYGVGHYCDNRLSLRIVDHGLSETVEVAIFDTDGAWYISEGMDNITEYPDGTRTAVIGWVNDERLFQIIDYISAMPGKIPAVY